MRNTLPVLRSNDLLCLPQLTDDHHNFALPLIACPGESVFVRVPMVSQTTASFDDSKFERYMVGIPREFAKSKISKNQSAADISANLVFVHKREMITRNLWQQCGRHICRGK